jgi:hypothetical protein
MHIRSRDRPTPSQAIQSRFAASARNDRENRRGEQEFFREFAGNSADAICAECGDLAMQKGPLPGAARGVAMRCQAASGGVGTGPKVNLQKESQ